MPLHDLSPLDRIEVPPDRRPAAIILFHAAGDILNATLISTQLRRDHKDYFIVFITCRRHAGLLAHNPDIDQVVGLAGEPSALDLDIPAIRDSRNWAEIFVPAAYFSPRLAQGWSIYRITREPVGITLSGSKMPVLVLSPAETAEARAYWASLPPGPKVLVETEFNSNQSPWNDDFVAALGAALAPFGVVFVFTALNRPAFLDEFQQRFGPALWCGLPFRLNAELFNLAQAFIGVSSGISVAASSRWCRRDVLWIEVCHGQLWSHVESTELPNYQICNDLAGFRGALGRLQRHFGGPAGTPDFAPRFPRADAQASLACPLCGRADTALIRGHEIVECPDCSFAYAPYRRKSSVPSYEVPDEELFYALAAERSPATSRLPLLHCRRPGSDFRSELTAGSRAASVEPGGFCLQEGRIGAILAPDTLDLQATPYEWLEEANYVLAPNGLLLLRVWNFGGFLSTTRGLDCLGPAGNLCFFTPDSLRRVLHLTGFLVRREWTETPATDLTTIAAVLPRLLGAECDNPAAAAKDLAEAGKGERIVVIAAKRGPSQYRASPAALPGAA